MVGINYQQSDYFLHRRGGLLAARKKASRKPAFIQDLAAKKRAEQRSKLMLEGKTVTNLDLPYGVNLLRLAPAKIEVCVCLPEMSINRDYRLARWGMLTSTRLDTFDRSIMGDVFLIQSQQSKLTAVCVLDFLDRLINLQSWPDVVPIHLQKFPNANVFYSHIDKAVNGGSWDFDKAVGRVMQRITICDLKSAINPKWDSLESKNALLATLRHKFTPYDYVWMTDKLTINDAQIWAKWADQKLEEMKNA